MTDSYPDLIADVTRALYAEVVAAQEAIVLRAVAETAPAHRWRLYAVEPPTVRSALDGDRLTLTAEPICLACSLAATPPDPAAAAALYDYLAAAVLSGEGP